MKTSALILSIFLLNATFAGAHTGHKNHRHHKVHHNVQLEEPEDMGVRFVQTPNVDGVLPHPKMSASLERKFAALSQEEQAKIIREN